MFTVGSFYKEARLLACRIFAGCREVHRHFIVRRCGSKAWFSLARRGVRGRALFVIGIIGGIGFTVALVVSSEVFADPAPQGEANMAPC